MASEININEIQQLCRDEAFRWTNHIHVRLQQRNIVIDDVVSTIINGEIIEQYPNDYPFPSCLLLGETIGKKPLHVVCGISSGELWMITAYHPNIDEWMKDFKVRRESL